MIVRILLALIVATGILIPASAHEVRPAYLAIEETEPGLHRVTWKQPMLGDRRLSLEPVLPDHCEVLNDGLPEHTGAALIMRWDVRCDFSHGLIYIQGLSRTLTDVMVRITTLDQEFGHVGQIHQNDVLTGGSMLCCGVLKPILATP